MNAMTVSVVNELLPPRFLERAAFQNEISERPRGRTLGGEMIGTQTEKERISRVRAVGLLVVNLLIGANRAAQNKDYELFDANAGDAQCQNRALLLHDLFVTKKEQIEAELKAISKECNGGLIGYGRHEELKGKIQAAKDPDSIKQGLESLKISEDLAFLGHCFLSRVMKVPYNLNESDGVVTRKSDYSRLVTLEPSIDKVPCDARRNLLEYNQERLSAMSAERLHALILSGPLGRSPEYALTCRMLSSRHHVVRVVDAHLPKTFNCLFYAMKAILEHCRIAQVVVCLEEIVPKDKKMRPIRAPFQIFVEQQEPTGQFSIIDSARLHPATPVLVFEAVMRDQDRSLGKEEVVEILKTHSLKEMVLGQSASEVPYAPGSLLEEVKDPEALEEIQSHRKLALPSAIQLNHVYFAMMGKIMKEGAGNHVR